MKKPACSMPVSDGLSGYCPRNALMMLLRHIVATIIKKIVGHGFS